MGELNSVDLFAGAGGLSLGFEMAGFQSKLAVEIDNWAAETFESNFPSSKVLNSDIRELENDDLVSKCPDTVHLLGGGPPCQDFSVSNRRNKEAKEPEDSLFKEFVDAVEPINPRAFVIENVPGIASSETTRGNSVLNAVEGFLDGIDYHYETCLLNSADYGVPQQRNRMFFIGVKEELYDGEKLIPVRTHKPSENDLGKVGQIPRAARKLRPDDRSDDNLNDYVTLWEAISDLPQIEAREGADRYDYPSIPQNTYQRMMRMGSDGVYNHEAMNHTDRIIERFKHIDWGESQSDVPDEHAPHIRGDTDKKSDVRYDQNNRRLYPNRASNTIAASFYSNFVHPYKHRNLTAREGARIQSFPDSHVFEGKRTTPSDSLLKREGREDEMYLNQYQQIGNAVPPLLAAAISDNLQQLVL